jgi:hypothetical protein
VVIHPPDGDMAAYLSSLARLQACDMEAIAPGHGEWIDDPHGKVAEYVAHRMARERAILNALERRGRSRVRRLVKDVYTDVPRSLHPIARFSVWAHLRKLTAEGAVTSRRPDSPRALWRFHQG